MNSLGRNILRKLEESPLGQPVSGGKPMAPDFYRRQVQLSGEGADPDNLTEEYLPQLLQNFRENLHFFAGESSAKITISKIEAYLIKEVGYQPVLA